jgi:hypothetical protein
MLSLALPLPRLDLPAFTCLSVLKTWKVDLMFNQWLVSATFLPAKLLFMSTGSVISLAGPRWLKI